MIYYAFSASLEAKRTYFIFLQLKSKTKIMAESKPVIVKNLDLFKSNRIFYHPLTKRLVALPDDEYLKIIKNEKVKFLSELPELEIECFFLNSETDGITDLSDTFKVEELEGIGYYQETRGVWYHTDKRF